ncbi:hypothetical protein EMIT0P176_280005 [Pseudomonas sp. IT-P176]
MVSITRPLKHRKILNQPLTDDQCH